MTTTKQIEFAVKTLTAGENRQANYYASKFSGKIKKYVFSCNSPAVTVLLTINNTDIREMTFEGLQVDIDHEYEKDSIIGVRVINGSGTNQDVYIGLLFEEEKG